MELIKRFFTKKRRSDSMNRQDQLFNLFAKFHSLDFEIVSPLRVDDFIQSGKHALFLKHDIHSLNLQNLLDFSTRQLKSKIGGVYFFMYPDHPHTVKAYSAAEQIAAMKELQEMGFDIGFHIDPYFLMHHTGASLDKIISNFLNYSEKQGVHIRAMNMHGNTGHKHADKNGYGTSFDLFHEIARQQDFPELKDVELATADLIRKNRVTLESYGIQYWCDNPLWSYKNQFVVTHFLSDNLLEKKQALRFNFFDDCAKGYALCSQQLPGSRNRLSSNALVATKDSSADFQEGEYWHSLVSFPISEVKDSPLLFLIHPQFYL